MRRIFLKIRLWLLERRIGADFNRELSLRIDTILDQLERGA